MCDENKKKYDTKYYLSVKYRHWMIIVKYFEGFVKLVGLIGKQLILQGFHNSSC